MKPLSGTIVLGILLTLAALKVLEPRGAPAVTLIALVCIGIAGLIVALLRFLFQHRRP